MLSSAAAAVDSPAAAPTAIDSAKPKPRPAKRKADAPNGPPNKAAKVVELEVAPKLEITITAKVSSMAEFAELIRSQAPAQ